MLQQLKQCPLCGNEAFTKYITCKDYTVSHEVFSLVTCTNCNFLFTNPRPQTEDLPKYYQSEDYISHQNKANNVTNFIYKIARRFTIRKKVKIVNSLSQRGTLLDIGCGTGHFLKACEEDKWNTSGIEPDNFARDLAAKQIDGPVHENIEQVKNQFNIITLWHVLEHLPDINSFMHHLTNLLAEDGHIIIAVPNHRSYDAAAYKNFWAAYDVPRHLYHFDQSSIKELSTKFGLQIKSIIPMKLDSYYVSLLSESYKGSNLTKYTNSLITGWKSNRYAKKNGNNYSSLIYILTPGNA